MNQHNDRSRHALTGEKSRTMLHRVAEAVMRTSRSGSSRRRKRGVDTSWSTMLPRSDLALRDRLRTHMHAASRTCAHMPAIRTGPKDNTAEDQSEPFSQALA